MPEETETQRVEHENIAYGTNGLIRCFANRFSYRKPHVHRSIELMYVCKGEADVISKGFTLSLKEGDFAIINSSTPHELISLYSQSCTALFVQLSRNLLDILGLSMTIFDDITVSRESPLMENIKSLLFELTECFFGSEQFDYLICLSKASLLLNLLLTNLSFHTIDDQSGRMKSADERIKKTCKYLDANYNRKVSLEELSKQVYVSPQYLSSLFSEAMGMTIREYIQKARFDHALHLIDYTDESLIDICFDAGFSDYKYMEKCFLKILGCTPNEYRQYSKTIEKPGSVQNKNNEEYIFSREETLSLIKEIKSKE